MSNIKKSLLLIGLGVMNFSHALLHLLQFLQSIILVKASTEYHHHHDEGILETMLHSPYFAILWGLIGIFTLWMGIKDFIHHKKCH